MKGPMILMTKQNYKNEFKQAQRVIDSLKENTKFEARDLLSPDEWSNISPTNFGEEFQKEVIAGRITGVIYKGKKSNNHSYYEKVRLSE
ncbi:DUF1413 domain-containing protein [Lactococcus petauri]